MKPAGSLLAFFALSYAVMWAFLISVATFVPGASCSD